jgi:hypothetical protein
MESTPMAKFDLESKRTRSGIAWALRLGGLAAALLVASLLVMRSSDAAFTSTTANSGNSFSAGTVDLVDDDAATAIFTISNMKPSDTVQGCITVTYQGTVVDPSAVKLYSPGYTDSGTFADYLNVTVEEGSGGSFASCAGFVSDLTIVDAMTLSTFASTYTDYTNGAGVWDPSGTPESKTYRFTVALDGATPNAQQGASVTGLTFTWEVQSN